MPDVRSIALSLIGGSPLNKVKQVIANGLPVTVAHDMAGLESLMGQVLSGGIGSVLQNPMAAVASNLSGLASSLAGSVSSDIATALTGASGLTSALSSLSGMTGQLSGLSQIADGQFGLTDVMSAASMLDGLSGVSLPVGLDMGTVLGPFNIASTLSGEATDYLTGLQSALSSGTITASQAVTQIGAYTSQITGAISASTSALSTLQGAAQGLASLGSVAGGLVSGPQNVQGFLGSLVNPSAAPSLQSAINSHMASISDVASSITESDTLS